MSNLLREYIKSILLTQQLYEAKPAKGPAIAPDRTQLWLLANKQLGYAAEWALWQACGGKGSFKEDSRLKSIYESATKTATKEKDIFDNIYAQMVDVATTSLGSLGKTITVEDSDLSNPPNSPDAKGGSTAKVDVPTDTVNFHVKYNDDKRLSGFQREKLSSEIDPATKQKKVLSPSSETATAYFAALKAHINEIIGDKKNLTLLPIFKKKSYDESGKELDPQPKGLQQSWLDANGILRKGAYGSKYAGTDMESDFEAAKKAYQSVIVRGTQRTALQTIFTAYELPQAIVNDIYAEFDGGKTTKTTRKKTTKTTRKTTIFAKFNTSPKNLSKLSLKGDTKADRELIEAYKASMSLSLIDYLGSKLIPQKEDVEAVLAYIAPNAKEVLNAKATAKLKGEKAVESKPTTLFYNVVDTSDKTKIYFQIEFRLDGEGHPPQLKVGPALSKAK